MKDLQNFSTVRRKFQRSHTKIYYPFSIIGFDLIDFKKSAGIYVAVWMELWSRFVNLSVIESKNENNLLFSYYEFLHALNKAHGSPIATPTDRKILVFCDQEGGAIAFIKKVPYLKVFHVNNSFEGPTFHSNPIVERFNRTFRETLSYNAVKMGLQPQPTTNLKSLIILTAKELPKHYNTTQHNKLPTPEEMIKNADDKDFTLMIKQKRDLMWSKTPIVTSNKFKVGDKVFLQKPDKLIITGGKTLASKYFVDPYTIKEITPEGKYKLNGIAGTFYWQQFHKVK